MQLEMSSEKLSMALDKGLFKVDFKVSLSFRSQDCTQSHAGRVVSDLKMFSAADTQSIDGGELAVYCAGGEDGERIADRWDEIVDQLDVEGAAQAHAVPGRQLAIFRARRCATDLDVQATARVLGVAAQRKFAGVGQRIARGHRAAGNHSS